MAIVVFIKLLVLVNVPRRMIHNSHENFNSFSLSNYATLYTSV